MQLVASELHDNLQVVRDYRYTYGKDKWVARRLLEADFSLAGFPSDTVETYSRYITGGMGKPYRLSNDALEMLKTTGIASHIADKQTLIDLLRCYKELAAFDDYMELYYDQRMQAMLPSQMENLHWNSPYHEGFEKTLADKTVRNWIGLIPRAFDDWFFGEYEKKLENMILLLEGALREIRTWRRRRLRPVTGSGRRRGTTGRGWPRTCRRSPSAGRRTATGRSAG